MAGEAVEAAKGGREAFLDEIKRSKVFWGFVIFLAIRRIIGLDANAVRTTFEQFIRKHPTLNSMQIQFLDMLQNYIAKF